MPRRKADVVEGIAYIPVVRLRGVAQPDPLTWEDTRDTVVVKAALIAGRPNARGVCVSDNAMTPWVIAGEHVVIDPDADLQDRQLVVATDNSGEVLVRWLRMRDDDTYLRAADGERINLEDVRLEGVAIYVERLAPTDPE